MYSDKKNRHTVLKVLAVLVIVAAAACAVFFARGSRDADAESAQAIRAAVERCALQCYAVEGVYPPDLAYLRENYGLQVNTEDFYVTYSGFASNLPPTVKVTPRHGGE